MNIQPLLSPEETLDKMIDDVKNYAAIYARKSIQTPNGSLEVQKKSCTTYAAKNNFIIYKVYEESISAVKKDVDHRNALSDMLEDAKRGLFKNLIIYKRDRLARRFEDYLRLKKQLHKLGINIYFSDESTYVANDDPMANFIDNMLMAVAELEPNRIRDKTIAGMLAKKEAGIYSCKGSPLGYTKSKDKRTLTTDIAMNFFVMKNLVKLFA